MSSISSYGSSVYGTYSQSQPQRPSKADMEAKLSSDFSSSDSSGNGSLSLDELTQMMGNMPPPPDGASKTSSSSSSSSSTSSSEASSKAQELIDAADSNGDGELSLEEMKAGMEKMHSNLQAKGDMMKQKISEQSGQNTQGGGFEQDMQSLASAIESGDLDGAKTLLEEMMAHKPPEGANSDMDSKRDDDFKALSDALDSGDSTAISTALETIQTNMSQGGNGSNANSNSEQGFNLQSILSKLASNYANQTSADLSSFLAISA